MRTLRLCAQILSMQPKAGTGASSHQPRMLSSVGSRVRAMGAALALAPLHPHPLSFLEAAQKKAIRRP